MKVKVFGSDGQLLSEDAAASEIARFGVKFDRAEEKFGELSEGSLVWRLVEFWVKTGHSSLITQALGEDGQPMENADVAFFWPTAPNDPEATINDWHPNFVHGSTNQNGEVGPGMGTGAYHPEYECGPHEVWMRGLPSDKVKCQGMLELTNHDHLDQKFQLMTVEGEGPGPTPPTDLSEELDQMGNRLKEISKLVTVPDSVKIKWDGVEVEYERTTGALSHIANLVARALGRR